MNIKYKEHLTKKEVKSILQNVKNVKRRNDLRYDETDTFDYYMLPDGKIIVVLAAGEATMYHSEQELIDIDEQQDVRGDKEHVLSNLIPDQRVFLNSINEYVEKLALKLQIPLSSLNKTLGSIKLIDSAYKKKRPSKQEFFNKDYLYLIAYLGEVYIREKGGNWIFKKQKDQVSYEPYIKSSDKKILDAFFELFRECYEDYDTFSIYNVASVELMR